MNNTEQKKNMQEQLNQLIRNVKAWPQYKKIAAGMIVLGIILLIIGLLLY